MRNQLSKYVELLFAGTTDTDEIQQEILQNSLDKFDDLISQGKSPEAAYRLTISGIGDINEILGQSAPTPPPSPVKETPHPPAAEPEQDEKPRKLLRSIAIALYILSAIPVIFSDGETLGLCLTLLIVAIATAIMVYIGKGKTEPPLEQANDFPPPKVDSMGRRTARAIVWLCGLCAYITLSVLTKGWYITWLIFPMTGCVGGIVKAIFDLKEAYRK